jgi:hypothetical protein
MIHTLETAIPIPYEALRVFCEAHHITKMWLFGSVLRDDFSPESDVDVLVEFDPAHVPGWNIVSIQEELSALLGREVEFSMPGALSRHVRPVIMDSAQVIYERV